MTELKKMLILVPVSNIWYVGSLFFTSSILLEKLMNFKLDDQTDIKPKFKWPLEQNYIPRVMWNFTNIFLTPNYWLHMVYRYWKCLIFNILFGTSPLRSFPILFKISVGSDSWRRARLLCNNSTGETECDSDRHVRWS